MIRRFSMDGTSPETAAARVVTDRRTVVRGRDLRASGAILVFSMGGMSRQRQEGPGEEEKGGYPRA